MGNEIAFARMVSRHHWWWRWFVSLTADPSANGNGPSRKRGQVLVVVAIALPALIGMVGFAVDLGRLYVERARLQAAADAAALAGAMWLLEDPELNRGLVKQAAGEYLNRNMPAAVLTSVTATTGIRGVRICAETSVGMSFMSVLGLEDRTVGACASAGFDHVEIALVLDNTSSMNGAPIQSVKQATNQLVNLMLPDGARDRVNPPVKVALVPFRGKVRIAGQDGLPDGCRCRDGRLNQGAPQETCLNPLTPVLPLSYDKQTIIAHVNRMTAPGGQANSGTLIMEGIKWGREVLTPEWPFEQGGRPDQYRKVMILLSDGMNTWYSPHDAFQAPPLNNRSCNNQSCRDAETRREADLAKAQGIEIFVIRYGNAAPPHAVELLRYVASSAPGTDDHYYSAPSPAEIPQVMRRIGRRLAFRLLS